MRSKSLLFLISLILFVTPAIYSQPLFSTYYSPLADRTASLPFLEIDFSSARLQGLGYQLYPVIRDTITDLFRNPVTIYNIEDKKIYFQVENAMGRYRSSLGSLYLTSQFNSNLFNPSVPYFSIGFWTSKSFLLNRPVGIFISGTRNRNFDENNRNVPTTAMIQDSYIEYSYNSKYEVKTSELFIRLWTGIINKPKFNLAASYQYTYHQYPNMNIRKEDYLRNIGSGFNQEYDEITKRKEPLNLNYHRISLGFSSFYKNWKVESALEYLKSSEKSSRTQNSDNSNYIYFKTNPDSIPDKHIQKIHYYVRSNPKTDLGAINFRASKNNWDLFLYFFFGQVTMDDNGQNLMNRFRTYISDTTNQEIGNFSSEFSDKGNLYRTKFGMGKQYHFKKFLNFYSALIFNFTRFSITGNLPVHDYYYELYYQSQPVITDTTYSNKIKYSSKDYRIYLPLGWEINYKNIKLRLGLTWYYDFHGFEKHVQSSTSREIEKRKSEKTSINRTEYFGLGYKYKKMEVQLATFGNVFEFNLWNVSCQYSF